MTSKLVRWQENTWLTFGNIQCIKICNFCKLMQFLQIYKYKYRNQRNYILYFKLMINENDDSKQFSPYEAKFKQQFQQCHDRALMQNYQTSLVSFECILILLVEFYSWVESLPSKNWIDETYFILAITFVAVRLWYKQNYLLGYNLRFISLNSYLIVSNSTQEANKMPIERDIGETGCLCLFLMLQYIFLLYYTKELIDLRKKNMAKSIDFFRLIVSLLIFIQMARFIFFPSTLKATFMELILGYAAGGALFVYLERREIEKKPMFHAWLEYSQALRIVCLPLYFETPVAFILFVLLQNVCLVVLNKKRIKSQTFDWWAYFNVYYALRFSQNTISQNLSIDKQKFQRVALLQKEEIKLDDEYCCKCIVNKAINILFCNHCFLCINCTRKEIEKSNIVFQKNIWLKYGVYCPYCVQMGPTPRLFLFDYFSDFWLEQRQGSNGNFRSKVYITQFWKNIENNNDDDE